MNNDSGSDKDNLKEYFDYLKKELLKENQELKQKLEESIEEIQYLKSNKLDEKDKDLLIDELKEKLKKEATDNLSGKQNNEEMAILLSENKKYKAEKIYFYYIIKEIIKLSKKQKHQVNNALSFLSEEDVQEIIKILKEFKLI